MKFSRFSIVGLLFLFLATVSVHAQQQKTQDTSGSLPWWELRLSPFAIHFSNENASDHKHVYAVGVERNQADGWLWGIAAFSNSFGQPSAYAYYGYRWDGLFENPKIYVKLTGGLLYGYKGEYQDEVPFNHDGFSPGILPTIGYRVTDHDAVEVGALGTAGLIFTYNRRF